MVLTETRIAHMLHAASAGSAALSDGYAEIDITEQTQLKCAAVLIPLVQDGEDWHILYTRRTQRVESHKGQVSFPGGGCDEGETNPEQTALREAQEEIGINPTAVRVLGRLTDLITITSFRVTPVVGVVNWPTVFRLNEHEVERVFTVPLAWLADSGNRWELPFPGKNRSVVVYHPYDGELVWGATARMTVDFVHTLGL
jgi:8-oxo-dGTP pyrophosphatase MutT (NUDIX family)